MKNRYFRLASRFIACCQRYDRPGVINTVPPDRGKLATLIDSSSKRRSLLFAGDRTRSVYDKKPQRYADDNRTAFNCTQW